MNDERRIPSDSELLSAIQTGDDPTRRDAKDQLIRKHDEKLTRGIAAYLQEKNCDQPSVHAKEVGRQAWSNALGHLEDLLDPEEFESWIAILWRDEANRHLKLCSDGDLLSAIQTGDEPTRQDATDQLIRKYDQKLTKRIETYLYRTNCNEPSPHAKEVRHQAWISALGHLKDLHAHGKFQPWLARIWRNEANRHLKLCIANQNTSRQLKDDSDLPPAQISDYYHSRDAAIDVDRMLIFADNIPGDFGVIFRLRIVKGWSFDKIAETTGKKKDSVRTQYYRGLRKMKAKFNDEDPEARC